MMVFVSVLLLSLASSLNAQSTVLSTMTSTAALSDVTKKPDVNAPKIANGIVQTTSRALSPAGTAADGSTTTYIEEEVEYQMTVLGGVTSTVSSTTRKGMRIQSQDGYVRIQTLPFESGAMSSVQSCTYGGGIRPGCVEVVGVEYLTTKEYRLATSTITTIQTLSTSATTNTLGAGDATIVQQALVTSVATQVVDAPPVVSTTGAPITTSISTYTPPQNGTAVDQHAEGGSQRSSILAPAIGGTVGGVLVILILIAIWALLRRRNREKTDAKARARLSDPEFAPQFKYHYRQSRMVTPSMTGSWKEEMEKGGITLNFDADSLYNVTTPQSPSSPSPKSTAHSI